MDNEACPNHALSEYRTIICSKKNHRLFWNQAFKIKNIKTNEVNWLTKLPLPGSVPSIMRTTVVAGPGPFIAAAFSARPFVLVAVVLVEGLLLVEDAALLGALPVEELVIDSALLPGDLLLGSPEAQDERLLRRLRLPRRRRRRRQFVEGNSYGCGGRGSQSRHRAPRLLCPNRKNDPEAIFTLLFKATNLPQSQITFHLLQLDPFAYLTRYWDKRLKISAKNQIHFTFFFNKKIIKGEFPKLPLRD